MMAFKLRPLIAVLIATLARTVVAAASSEAPLDLEAVLRDSQRGALESRPASGIPKIRLNALKEAALGYGVRSGLARRASEIASVLNHNQRLLNSIYNFAAMLLEKNVMPPVLGEAQHSLNQPDSNTIRIADATYRIERQAQFVIVPPHWRDYLMRDFHYSTELPASVLLPQTDTERAIWRQFVRDGWKIGVPQAEQIFQQSLARLERDYKGMILYRRLLAQGMISKPYIAAANMGITGNGNAINFNDRILRITAKPQFEMNVAIWKPLVLPK